MLFLGSCAIIDTHDCITLPVQVHLLRPCHHGVDGEALGIEREVGQLVILLHRHIRNGGQLDPIFLEMEHRNIIPTLHRNGFLKMEIHLCLVRYGEVRAICRIEAHII